MVFVDGMSTHTFARTDYICSFSGLFSFCVQISVDVPFWSLRSQVKPTDRFCLLSPRHFLAASYYLPAMSSILEWFMRDYDILLRGI